MEVGEGSLVGIEVGDGSVVDMDVDGNSPVCLDVISDGRLVSVANGNGCSDWVGGIVGEAGNHRLQALKASKRNRMMSFFTVFHLSSVMADSLQ
jgi:hypothetical protein